MTAAAIRSRILGVIDYARTLTRPPPFRELLGLLGIKPVDKKVRLDGSELLCPRCGYGNLHHGTVRVFGRYGGECGDTFERRVDYYGRVWRLDHPTDNPSYYRGGIAITVTCEHCHGPVMELTLAQHKGATLLAWRDGDHTEDMTGEGNVTLPPMEELP